MKRFGKKTLALTSVLVIFIFGVVFGWGMCYEYVTGLPAISLIAPKQESVGTPDMALKTTEEAKQVVEEAVKDEEYGVGYNCLDYAWDSMRALKWDGQPAWIAGVVFEDGTGHSLVLTATTDGGWKFLDPQSGLELTPVPGGYWGDNKIVAVQVRDPNCWVDFADFVLNPMFEVIE